MQRWMDFIASNNPDYIRHKAVAIIMAIGWHRTRTRQKL